MKLSIDREKILNKSIENKSIKIIEENEFYFTLKENEEDSNPIIVHKELMNRITEEGIEEFDVVLEWIGGTKRISISEWISLY